MPRPEDPQSFNRYAYARNSPLVRVDPSGHLDIPWDKIREAVEQAAGDCLQRVSSCLGAPPLALPSIYAMAALTTNVAETTSEARASALMAKGKTKDDENDKSGNNQGGSAGGPGGGGDNLSRDLSKEGRKGKQQRLRELGKDPKQPSEVRGWIKQDLNEIARGKRDNIRVPPQYDLAHKRGFEARKGFGYKFAELVTKWIHKLQHKHEGYK